MKVVRALVDSGCSQAIISGRLLSSCGVGSERAMSGKNLVTVDGSVVTCGEVSMPLKISGHSVDVTCLVLDNLLVDFDLVLGMDVITLLGGLQLNGVDGSVQFGLTAPCDQSEVVINDVDFDAHFQGGRWIVKWKWSDKEPNLSNQTPCYSMRPDLREKFNEEIQSWIDEEILVPVPKFEKVSTIIP